ncbi:MAG: ATP-binding protein, partial [Deltaproteobacteria bacterium]|nr:ATP-binding protein [Deltaproteobacteria bacterium]
MREDMLGGKTGMDEYTSGGHRERRGLIRKLIAYAPIRIDEQIWSIAVVYPYSDVTQVVWGSFRNSAWLLAITACILLLGTFVGHKINQGRIRAEEKVRWGEEIVRSQSRLQTIFDGAPDAIAIVTRDYRISMLNKTGLAWYGRPLEAFRGFLCYQEFQGRTELCPHCPAEETFRTGKPAFRQKASLIAGGKKHYLQIFTFPLRNRAGEVVEVVEYVKDVTGEKDLQQKIIQTERLAVVGRMAANVAHEIKNPLGTIVLNAELMEDELANFAEPDVRESRSLLGGIKSEIDRLLEVIEEYLQFARLPKAQLDKGNVNEVIADLLSFLKEETGTRNILVVQELEPSLPAVQMDANQLRQAFLNIIKNSLDAMAEGGKLKLTVCTTSKNGQVEIMIADTGRGIPEQEIDFVFTPFFSTKHGGTGLGLPITAHIIQEHGGDIRFESYLDLGTIFRIYLPVDSLPSTASGLEGNEETGSLTSRQKEKRFAQSQGDKVGGSESPEHLIGG